MRNVGTAGRNRDDPQGLTSGMISAIQDCRLPWGLSIPSFPWLHNPTTARANGSSAVPVWCILCAKPGAPRHADMLVLSVRVYLRLFSIPHLLSSQWFIAQGLKPDVYSRSRKGHYYPDLLGLLRIEPRDKPRKRFATDGFAGKDGARDSQWSRDGCSPLRWF